MNPSTTSALPLSGRVAIVSGGTQGLGADIARGLAEAGAQVMIVGRDRARGDALAADIGERARFVAADIGDDAQIAQAIDAALGAFGGLDILVNNACIYADAGLQSTRAQWHRTLDINLVSAAIFAKQVAPHLRTGGVIVNIGSTGGKFGAAGRMLYPASKAALLQITRNLAATLAPKGIRVVSVSPAWTWSPSVEAMAGGSLDVADRVGAHFHPLGRVGRGEEIARAVAFVASPAASWITGADISVDGGFSMLGPDRGIAPRAWFEQLGAGDTPTNSTDSTKASS